jgi:hypothetical protein
MALKEADKRVVRAFAKERAAEGSLLSTDGRVLEKHGLGGHVMARWGDGDVVWLSDESVASDFVVKRALKKEVPAKLFREPLSHRSSRYDVDEEEGRGEYAAARERRTFRNPLPRQPETPAHVRAASRGRSSAGEQSSLFKLREMVREREGREFDPYKRGTWRGSSEDLVVNPGIDPGGGGGTYNEIVYGIATGLWYQAWADAVEEAGSGRMLSGARIEDIAPPPDDETLEFAIEVGLAIEAANGGETLDELYHRAKKAGRAYGKGSGDPEVFGYYLAMESLGHGVSWLDDWNTPAGGWFKIPRTEFYMSCDEDGDNCEVQWKEVSKR